MPDNYTMTDEDRKALTGWFGSCDGNSEEFTTTIDLVWMDGTGWQWRASWHTLGQMMGTGSEGVGPTLAAAIEAMERAI